MKYRLPTHIIPALAVVFLVSACAPDRVADRADFLAAEAALEAGDTAAFEALADSLGEYPLYPYLLYRKYAYDLADADPQAITAFLEEHADTPQAERLRRAWLDHLAAGERWNEYLRHHVADASRLRRCRYLHGLLATGQQAAALDEVESLWLYGKSLPAACDPVLAAFKQSGRLTADLVWRRIALAMDSGELGLVRYLGRFLPQPERIWVDRWRVLHRDPDQILDTDWIWDAHPYRTRILTHGITRLARKAPQRAADAWDRFAEQLDIPSDQAQRAHAAVGFALVGDADLGYANLNEGQRRGLDYLDRIPAREDNLDTQERRLRMVLRLRDWQRIADWIAAMPDGQRKTDHWFYWQARAEEFLGDLDSARVLYEAAATERSLWGFLAAERIGSPYQLDSAPTPADPQRIADIERSAAAARMHELGALGRTVALNREWRRLTRDMDNEDLMAAAVIAQRRGWPDKAIFTLAKSGYWDDLALRFPLLYRELVQDQADATDLAASWIYAVLRQESTFNPGVVSVAGAKGLMQLMPATAREVAKSLGLPPPTSERLFEPDYNITLGSHYLARMRKRFDRNPALATAAYNAGPARVRRWIPHTRVDADLWIATIPVKETRDYVRRVLAYRLIYDYRLGTPIEPLREATGWIGQASSE